MSDDTNTVQSIHTVTEIDDAVSKVKSGDVVTLIKGKGAPTSTTAGLVGSRYIDTATKDEYRCTEAEYGVYTWIKSGETAYQYARAGGYEGTEQEFSEKLAAEYLTSEQLSSAINQALQEAHDSGEFDGANGQTPQKGIDYWTEADKQEMVNDVLEALPEDTSVESRREGHA